MKITVITAAIAASALIMAASCTNSEIAPEVVTPDITDITCKTFTAVIDQETTKTVLTDEYKVNWESGDLININGAVYSATSDESNATRAEFKYESGTEPEPTYKAVFPADLYNAGSYAFPATQTYSAGKFNAPMYAESESEDLSFKNICGVICLSLKGTGSVRKIAVTAYEPLCGSFTMTDASTISLTGTGKTVTLDCDGSGVQLNEETATKFYIYLAPGTYSAGMKFVITDINGGFYEKITTKDVTIERSNVYTFNWTANFAPALPLYALPGKFSVADDKQVHFACGNLYATKSIFMDVAYWALRIYSHQYDCNSLNTGESRTATEDDTEIDLFTWGYDASTSLKPTGTEYVSDFTDWGSMIRGEVGVETVWRTPTIEEWQYLFTGRSNASNLYKCGVTVCEKQNCVVIAPDNWNLTASPLQSEYSATSTPMTWSEAQAAGLVCLPAAGFRYGPYVNVVGSEGNYWSSSVNIYSESEACAVRFSSRSVNNNPQMRFFGCSVRLVTDCE